jgi:hypothetical protein
MQILMGNSAEEYSLWNQCFPSGAAKKEQLPYWVMEQL